MLLSILKHIFCIESCTIVILLSHEYEYLDPSRFPFLFKIYLIDFMFLIPSHRLLGKLVILGDCSILE